MSSGNISSFKDGIFNGKGQYNDKDGNLFDGEFKNGKKEGQGVLIKKDGEKLEGKFRYQILMRINKCNDKLIQEIYNISNEYNVKHNLVYLEINPNNLT